MAVAWSRDKVGRATADVTIRDQVVVTATLPRFLLNGDRGTMHLDVDNVEGQAGRLPRRGEERRRQRDRQCRAADAAAQRQAAQRRVAAADGARRGRRQRHGARQRTGRLCARTQLRARGQAGDADPRAPHGADRGARRERHAVERPVRRPRAGNRQRVGLGRAVDRARRGGAAGRARPLSVRLHRADHQPRAAAALCQRPRQRGASRARRRGRPAHPGVDRPAAVAAGLERLVRAVVGGRRRRLARCLCHRLPDPRRANATSRCPTRPSGWRCSGCATSSATPRTPAATAGAISPMRSMCWRATARRRSATCAISSTPSSTISRPPSPRRSLPPRSACSATRSAPSASTRRRCARWRRSRRWNTAASTTARSCATARR